jgi:hypothetical protein
VAQLVAEQLVVGLTDPKHYPAFVKMLLEYDIGRPKSQTEVGLDHRRQIPKMVFLHGIRKVVVPAPRKSVPGTTASARAKIDWNWPRTRPRYAWPRACMPPH